MNRLRKIGKLAAVAVKICVLFAQNAGKLLSSVIIAKIAAPDF